MKPRILVYVDAPQHAKIAAVLGSALEAEFDVHVAFALQSTPSSLSAWPASRLHALPPAAAWILRLPRVARILAAGLARNATLRELLRAMRDDGPLGAVVVFNDTGVPQRRLLQLALRQGLDGVLVQDGLTEAHFREARPAFRVRHQVTRHVLAPLGLAFLGSTPYGTGGARTILTDGPAAARFFQARAGDAAVRTTGLLRPGRADGPHLAESPELLFWAVDFLGGLHDRALHELQLRVIQALAGLLADAAPTCILRVRLHPGDVPHAQAYAPCLAQPNVRISDPRQEPDATLNQRTVASVSLQSAGVFDALAAGIPSWFLFTEDRRLHPAWLPGPLAIDLRHVGWIRAMLRRLVEEAQERPAVWREQVSALSPYILIPFDVDAIRAAFRPSTSR